MYTQGRSMKVVMAMLVLSVLAEPRVDAQRPVASDHTTVTPDERITTMLAQPVTLRLDHIPLKHAVDAVAAATNIRIQYQGTLLDAAGIRVTLNAVKLPLGIALERILMGTALQAVPVASDLVTIEPMAGITRAKSSDIRGRVTDATTHQPLYGAKISVDAAKPVVESDADGRFALVNVGPGEHTVTVKLIGYRKMTRQVHVEAGVTATVEAVLDPQCQYAGPGCGHRHCCANRIEGGAERHDGNYRQAD